MNKPIATSLQRKAQFALCLCLLVGVLGALTNGYTQKTQRPLRAQHAVEKENATTLRAKKGFRFELNASKKIVAVEISTRRFVVMSDGICGGGCTACSGLIDSDNKIICKGCNANSACKLL